MKFVGLHSHTGFSIGDGLSLPKKHYDFALSNGLDAMATTDHGNLNAASYMLDAQKEFDKKGVPFKIIFGCEMYIHPSISDWKKTKEGNIEEKVEEQKAIVEDENESKSKWFNPINRRHHLVVLAQNYQGLENLFRLISKSYRGDNFYRYPRVDFSLLKEHNEGLIISTACLAGLPSWLTLRDHEKGTDYIQSTLNNELSPLLDIFGKDRAFLEIQFNKLPEQRIVNDQLIKFSKSSGYKLIATADSHYPDPKLWRDREIYRLLIAQSRGGAKTIDDLPKTIDELKCELYPKNGDDMFKSYKEMYGNESSLYEEDVKCAIELTHDIAHNQIGKIKPNSLMKLPNISSDPFVFLKDACVAALKKKNLYDNKQYRERLEKELSVIKEKNFSDYFIALQRSLNVIKKKSLMSPCRGSGGGSLVCYLLNITQIDPVKNNLLFERFLSTQREEAPDIDCLDEDILVKTTAGNKKMSELSVGDVVFDINDKPQKVLVVNKRKKREKEVVYSVFIDFNGVIGCVVASEDHFFLSKDGNKIKTKELKSGTRLYSNTVSQVLFARKNYRYKKSLIDITVENTSTFRIIPFSVIQRKDGAFSISRNYNL